MKKKFTGRIYTKKTQLHPGYWECEYTEYKDGEKINHGWEDFDQRRMNEQMILVIPHTYDGTTYREGGRRSNWKRTEELIENYIYISKYSNSAAAAVRMKIDNEEKIAYIERRAAISPVSIFQK